MFYNCQILESAPVIRSTSMAERCCYEMFYNTAIVSAEDILPTSGDASRIVKLNKQCFYGMFKKCESLKTPPVLPRATVALEMSCYEGMFSGCTSLESAPDLPATVMAESCYSNMFSGCGKKTYSNGAYEYSGLSYAPSMTLMALAEKCCYGMFDGCYNLSDASGIDLSYFTRFDKSCFEAMFSNCENLSSLPTFPSSPVAMSERCCYQMFYNCGSENYVDGSYVYTGFTSAPALEISSLADYCFSYMFCGCEALEDASSIDISTPTVFPKCCFYDMFSGCGKLTSVPVFPSSPVTLGEYSCYYMFSNCGDKRSSGGTTVFTGLSETPDIEIASVSAYSCIGMFNGCKNLSDASGIDLSAVSTFAESCFSSMFSSCEKLASAPAFSSSPVTMAERCCDQMFYGCGNKTYVSSSYVFTGLSAAPSIKVASSEKNCCYYMFSGCKNLTNANGIDLSSVTDFAESCLESMFNSCEKLSSTPLFPEESVAIGKRACYRMFYGCGSETWTGSAYVYTGITGAPGLKVSSIGESGCEGMFLNCYNLISTTGIDLSGVSALEKSCFKDMLKGCKQLTNLPTMPGASVAMEESCYESMFRDCKSLVSSPSLGSTTLAKNCYKQMFSGCGDMTWQNSAYVYSGLKDAPVLPATVLAEGCYYSMFNGCYNLGTGTQMPVISATTPAASALYQMFYNCKNLDKIKIAFMSDPSDSNVYKYWADSVKSSGTLYVPTGSTVNAMVPSGWTKATY